MPVHQMRRKRVIQADIDATLRIKQLSDEFPLVISLQFFTGPTNHLPNLGSSVLKPLRWVEPNDKTPEPRLQISGIPETTVR
jgi:hypothetical protein